MKKQATSNQCFVCGEKNPAGVHVSFYEQDDGSVLARFTPSEDHQGYPGRMHGGVITAVLDEAIGRAINARYGEDIWGVTMNIAVRFRKPVPVCESLTAIGRITEDKNRIFEGTGELYLPDGEVAATAEARYYKLGLDELVDFDPVQAGWLVRPD